MRRLGILPVFGIALASAVATAQPSVGPAKGKPTAKKQAKKLPKISPLSEHEKLLLEAKGALSGELCVCKDGTLAPRVGRMTVQGAQREFRAVVEVQCMVPSPAPPGAEIGLPGKASDEKACTDFVIP